MYLWPNPAGFFTRYHSGLIKIRDTFLMLPGDKVNRLLEVHRQHLQEIAMTYVNAYFTAYRDEDQLPSDVEIAETTLPLVDLLKIESQCQVAMLHSDRYALHELLSPMRLEIVQDAFNHFRN